MFKKSYNFLHISKNHNKLTNCPFRVRLARKIWSMIAQKKLYFDKPNGTILARYFDNELFFMKWELT